MNVLSNGFSNPKDQIASLKKEIQRLQSAIKREKYGLVWLDVPEAFEEESEEKIPVLKEVEALEIKNNDGKPTNILIEGENFHALTCLNYTHKGKIDVIYIDPPYNTGSDGFRYKDKRFLKEFPDGTEMPKDHPLRHSYWLSFMSKRLKLAKNLLKDDGVIFISIDDNEMAQLKLLCDEIFGENIGLISVINNFKGRSDDKFFATANEYLLVYTHNSKNVKIRGFEIEENKIDEYQLSDNISSFKIIDLRKTGKGWQRNERPNMFYPILFKDGEVSLPLIKEIESLYDKSEKVFRDNNLKYLKQKYEKDDFIFIIPRDKENNLGRWRWGIQTFLKNIEIGNVQIKKTSEWKVFEKMRPTIGDTMRATTPKTIFYKSEYDSGSAGIFLSKIISKNKFENPKSIYLIKDIFKISSKPNSVILDFFAGSGTTGHAVLDLNNEDGGKRQFILCTNNENKICEDVCYPRVEKVINGYTNSKGEKVAALGGSLKYYRTAFVGKNGITSITDDDRIELSQNAGELLSIAENTLYLNFKNDYFQIFQQENKFTCIYFREELIEFKNFVNKIKTLDGKKSVYVFSWGNEDYSYYFENISDCNVKNIPQQILEIYKKIKSI
jgi:adenine-specific DNA-methyltransferase